MMKRPLVFAVGLFALMAALLGVLYEPPLVASLSRQTYDAMLRRAAVPPRSGHVVMVDIDEPSLKALGQWPWPRAVLADLTRRLWDYGAAVVVFDIVFPEPDRTSPHVAQREWSRIAGREVQVEGLPSEMQDFDAWFASALRSGRSLLGCYLEMSALLWEGADEDPLYRGRWFERGEPQRRFLPQARCRVGSLPVLREAATSEAFFNTMPDRDNVVRRTPLVFQVGPRRIYPAMGLEATRLWLGLDAFGIEYDRDLGQGVRAIRLGERRIPTDAHGCLLLNFRSQPFPAVSAVDVLSGVADPALFSNRMAFIGASAAGLLDLKATPLAADVPGIEVHATAVDNMLVGDMLWQPRWTIHAHLALTLGVGIVLLLVFGRARAWTGFAVAVACVALAVGASGWLLIRWRFVLLPTGVVLATVSTYTLMTVVRFWEEERERRRLRARFGPMVSQEVLEYMETHPERVSLTGRKVEATVFFSDLVNFTRIAESLPPDVLTTLMNCYLTPMADLIMQRRGYVDKFDGDAIVAVWGAPLPSRDHAASACLAALDQLKRMETLRAELKSQFGVELFVRIGISTGEVVAGNMGSARRFQYTVMGDPVNQASRFLQDACKAFGVPVVVSEATFAQAREHVEGRCLGSVRVRGKTQPVRIYEVMGRCGELAGRGQRLAAEYAEALACFERGQRDACRAKLEAILKEYPDDGPARFLLAESRAPRADPVIEI